MSEGGKEQAVAMSACGLSPTGTAQPLLKLNTIITSLQTAQAGKHSSTEHLNTTERLSN